MDQYNIKYKKYLAKYLAEKNKVGGNKNNNHSKGLMVLAPMGSGKSYWIRKLPDDEKEKWLDGDELLEKLKIKNKNYYWYTEGKEKERNDILDAFQKYLSEGFHILYSGNPEIIPTDVLVIPNRATRENRLKCRGLKGEFVPTPEQFNREQLVYEKLATKIPYVINGDMPDYKVMNAILLNIHQTKI